MSAAAEWVALESLFMRRLGERVAAMQLTTAGIEAREAGAYGSLARQFHSLAGIGGTFGHQALTDIAFEGEQACNRKAPAARVIHFVDFVAEYEKSLRRDSISGRLNSVHNVEGALQRDS